ncbi:hypothetical protein PAAG_11237 [Paracoccidioides lutzii Pb01]|uniref:Uncharacterized protein n=1 Tax=Paracoccidioides lutzii (strain ATCC MYA-826 / Pb01) TaxID=502779 RepID=A0A0A2V2N9_PARBA|nr:hypothetical protein PAAG_11237 [Paracoccidioides lutzii Pb01]KGQ02056.1 hypothetical protein PAAG_11237 [Paracoccidioides lutzii Pb01]
MVTLNGHATIKSNNKKSMLFVVPRWLRWLNSSREEEEEVVTTGSGITCGETNDLLSQISDQSGSPKLQQPRANASPCQPLPASQGPASPWLKAKALAQGFAKVAQGQIDHGRLDSANLSFSPFLPQERTMGASQLELGADTSMAAKMHDHVTECKHGSRQVVGRFQSSFFQVAPIGSCSLGAQSLVRHLWDLA